MEDPDEEVIAFHPKPVYGILKRGCDFFAASFALLILSPVILVVSLIIKLNDNGPVFYRAPRVGRNGIDFRMLKFRTMVVDADKMGASSTTEGDPRLTKIGMALRKRKLDEIPQLLNVFAGSMSFVGPRPQIKWAVDQYSETEKLILRIPPGMTDEASIEFSNEEEILAGSSDPDADYMRLIHPRKMELSLEYLKKRSLWTDFAILWRTASAILKK